MFKEKWRMMYELVEKKPPKCLPEIYELIVYLHKNSHQLSVASVSPLLWVTACLNNAKPYNDESFFESRLIDIFADRYFSAEGCKNNKPDPELLFIAHDSFDHLFDGTTYTIGDGRGDVLA